LLETNRNNRMAIDYLMAFHILETNLGDFVDHLKDYSYYNLKQLPVSWEEALAIHVMRNKGFPEGIPPSLVSEDCLKRITSFTKILRNNKNDIQSAKNSLFNDFGETYWYYWFYLNPKVTNALKSKTEVK